MDSNKTSQTWSNKLFNIFWWFICESM